MKTPRSNVERLVSVAVELAILGLVWRALDGPDPLELARDVFGRARAWADDQLGSRRAMLADLETIRDLPETDKEPNP